MIPRRVLPRARVLLALSTAAAGCGSQSTLATSRGRVWAQPGDAPVFVWLVRDRTTTTHSLEVGGGYKRSDEFPFELDWEKRTGTRVDRTWVIAIDPATGRSMQLARTNGAVHPFYWDARRAVLWVQGAEDRKLIGLTPTGVMRPGGATFVTTPNLPPPFAVRYGDQSARLYNAQTNTELRLELDAVQGWRTSRARGCGSGASSTMALGSECARR